MWCWDANYIRKRNILKFAIQIYISNPFSHNYKVTPIYCDSQIHIIWSTLKLN